MGGRYTLLRVGGVRWLGSLLILWSDILGVVRERSSALSLPIMSVRQEGERAGVYAFVRRIFHLLDWQVVHLKMLVS